jgi:hypothetical protein
LDTAQGRNLFRNVLKEILRNALGLFYLSGEIITNRALALPDILRVLKAVISNVFLFHL